MQVSLFHSSVPLALCAVLALTSAMVSGPRESAVSTPAASVAAEPPAYAFDLYVPRAGITEAGEAEDFEFVDPLEHPSWYERAHAATRDVEPIDEELEGLVSLYLLERPDDAPFAFTSKCLPLMQWFAPNCLPAIQKAGFGGKYGGSPCPGQGCRFTNAQLRVTFAAGGGVRAPIGGFTGGIVCPGGPTTFVSPCPGGGNLRVRFFCACF